MCANIRTSKSDVQIFSLINQPVFSLIIGGLGDDYCTRHLKASGCTLHTLTTVASPCNFINIMDAKLAKKKNTLGPLSGAMPWTRN